MNKNDRLNCRTKDYMASFGCILKDMICGMCEADMDDSISGNFIRQMIPLAQGGIMMAKAAMCYCICDELKPILESIISGQEKAIAEMKCVAECLNCKCMCM